ncbi:MAG: ABC transporter substrate binding protein [Desulfobacteraceae bacterium]|nr:ABC transporter substrate binding protein [Desulfobacteraceae bacterium]
MRFLPSAFNLQPSAFLRRVGFLCALLGFFLCGVSSAFCQEAAPAGQPFRVVLVVSASIRPYIEALDGIRGELDRAIQANVEVVMLDRYDEKSGLDMADRLIREKPTDLVAAIGPEAAALVWRSFPGDSPPRIYSLILNPEKVIGVRDRDAGISLNIPPKVQLQMIHQGLPSLRRIGIFYDPANNRDFYDKAAAAALEMAVELVPMVVAERKDIPFLLQECVDSLDGVWLIPDRTVISESIAQYIIKQSVLRKMPVIGYNQFFYDSGAALAFVFDYAELGRQTAGLIIDALNKKKFGARTPVFKVWLNEAVLKKLEIKIPARIQPPVMVGP